MSNNSEISIQGLERWMRELNTKFEKLVETVTRMEEHNKQHAEKKGELQRRVEVLEKENQAFREEHQFLKEQIRMLTMIGGAVVGVSIIAEVVILVLK